MKYKVLFILYYRAATKAGMEPFAAMDWAHTMREIDRKQDAEFAFIANM
jgi:hypothetical protein